MARRKHSTREEAANPGGKTGDFGSVIAQICEEKGISKERVLETIEAALAAAYKKDYGRKGQNVKAIFDEKTGHTKFFLVKEVVDETMREFPTPAEEELAEEIPKLAKKNKSKEKTEEMEESSKASVISGAEEGEEKLPRFNLERDLTLEEAQKIKSDAKVGDVIELELESQKNYGRVAAQTAKQVVIQRIREAERDSMFEEYKDKEGEIVSGIVQRIEGSNVFIDLGKAVGVLFPSEQIERENYRVGQRVKIYINKVEAGNRGPGITLSRVHPEMVRKLFELEVPEIFAGTVEIKSIAREAGERTKIAVYSNEEGIDPIGSCVGQKGTRVMSVIDELGGEKIDIILWNEDPAKFIASSLSPAKVLQVDLNEETKESVVRVPEDQLSLAIGKHGQNVRLAAKLTGWKIDIMGIKPSGEETAPEGEKKEEAETETEKAEIDVEEGKEEKNEENKEESEK